jgi:hypothetical protein
VKKFFSTDFLHETPYRQIAVFGIPVILFGIVLVSCFASKGSQQFADLANAFIHGQLNFLKPIGGLGQDPVFYKGKIFWDDGPFPALLLIPFVALFDLFHLTYYQGYLMWLIAACVPLFIYAIARKLGYSKEDGWLLGLSFALGSVFIGVTSISSSWFFAQVLNTFLLFWALYEFYYHKRYWWIGILCACVLMTRATSIPIVLFFALEIWQGRGNHKQKLFQYVQLGAPLLVAIVLLGTYNYLRFQSPFNGGYMMQLLHGNAVESRAIGVFSIKHIPTNFYYAFLTAPVPVTRDTTSWTLRFPFIADNVYGMSLFITSPYYLYFFGQKWRAFNIHARNLLIATVATALIVFSYYGVGLIQFGYRYSLDFLPTLFVLFMIVYRKTHSNTTTGMKTLLIGAGILDFYLLWTLI